MSPAEQGPARPRLRHRRRGRLDPHRRGPHAAHHLAAGSADAAKLYYKFASIVRGLERDVDYEVDEEKRTVAPTEAGIEKVEQAARRREPLRRGVSRTSSTSSRPRCKAKELYKRDKDYIIQHGEVKIVDEFTGRILEGRRWSEGLHQAVEAKEGVKIKEENQTLATITLQNYFRMYDKLAGMTGTAATEAAEFAEHLQPAGRADPHQPADRPRRPGRPDLQDRGRQVRRRRRRPRRALRDGPAGARRHDLGREVREPLPAAREAGHPPRGAQRQAAHPGGRDRRPGRPPPRRHRRHQHGRPRRRHPPRRQPRGPRPPGRLARLRPTGCSRSGPADAADEMGDEYPSSGRGRGPLRRAARALTDECKAEGDKVRELGGLYVLGTERHESRRIDNQLRGRSGRQGDPARAASTCPSRTSSCGSSPPGP